MYTFSSTIVNSHLCMPNKTTNTYAARLKAAIRIRYGRRPSLRQLSKDIGYSYEHIRKVLDGWPVASEGFNQKICEWLHLDTEDMWRTLLADKMRDRYGVLELAAPPDRRLADLWPRLGS